MNWNELTQQDLKPLKPIEAHFSATASEAMATSSHPLATEAALWALRRGGSAADAYVVAALAQTVLEPNMTSLAGGLGLSYFDAADGLCYSLFAGFEFPEHDDRKPLTAHEALHGRAVMIPGFVRGLEAVHQRWGKLPWAELFEPALIFAEDGFIMDHRLFGDVYSHRQILCRFPEGQAVWSTNGQLPSVGQRFHQPLLAKTLRGLCDEGADYCYTGPWGQHFVDTLNQHGAVVTLEDMRRFRVEISEGWRPIENNGMPTYRGYVVGEPRVAMYGLALNLAEAGDLRSRGLPTENADALYYQMRIMQETWRHAFLYGPDNHDVLLSKDYAKQIWKTIEHGPPQLMGAYKDGTCALVMADNTGSVATGTHSHSGNIFGNGIFVDGVALNRVMFMRHGSLPNGILTYLWLFKEGKPILASASPSHSWTENLLQNTFNQFEFGMTLEESVKQPRFGNPVDQMVRVEGDFSQTVIQGVEQRGIPLMSVSPGSSVGNYHAIRIDHVSRKLQGVADYRRRGMAKGC